MSLGGGIKQSAELQNYEDNLRGTLEEGEFGFENDFTVRFDNLDYDQVRESVVSSIRLCFLHPGNVCGRTL